MTNSNTMAAIVILGFFLAGCSSNIPSQQPLQQQIPNSQSPTPANNTPNQISQSSQPIPALPANMTVKKIMSYKEIYVGSIKVQSADLKHGSFEPAAITVEITPESGPIIVDLTKINPINRESLLPNGSCAYYKYEGKIYKINDFNSGDFPIKSSITVSSQTVITFVGVVGAATGTGVTLEVQYNNSKIGSYTMSDSDFGNKFILN